MKTLNAREMNSIFGGESASTGGSLDGNALQGGSLSDDNFWKNHPHPPIIGGPVHIPKVPLTDA